MNESDEELDSEERRRRAIREKINKNTALRGAPRNN